MAIFFGYTGAQLGDADFRLTHFVATDPIHAFNFYRLEGSCDEIAQVIVPVMVSSANPAGFDDVTSAMEDLGWDSDKGEWSMSFLDGLQFASSPETDKRVLNILRDKGFDALVCQTVMTNYTINICIPLDGSVVDYDIQMLESPGFRRSRFQKKRA